MKRYLILALIIGLNLQVFSQDYKIENNLVVVERVIPANNLSIEQTHDAIETYFAGAYGDSNTTQKVNTQTHLVYKGLYTDLGTFNLGAWTISAEHAIDVQIKENRCKVRISCSTADARSSRCEAHYQIAKYVPVTDYFNVWETGTPKNTVISVFEVLVTRMNNTMASVEHALSNVPAEEDW